MIFAWGKPPNILTQKHYCGTWEAFIRNIFGGITNQIFFPNTHFLSLNISPSLSLKCGHKSCVHPVMLIKQQVLYIELQFENEWTLTTVAFCLGLLEWFYTCMIYLKFRHLSWEWAVGSRRDKIQSFKIVLFHWIGIQLYI